MRRQFFWMLFLFLPVLVKAQIADDGLKFLVTSAYEKNDSIKINNFRIQQAKIDEQTTEARPATLRPKCLRKNTLLL